MNKVKLTGKVCRKMREEACMSIEMLANKSGVHRNSIYKFENENTIPRPQTLRKIMLALGMINDNGSPPPQRNIFAPRTAPTVDESMAKIAESLERWVALLEKQDREKNKKEKR